MEGPAQLSPLRIVAVNSVVPSVVALIDFHSGLHTPAFRVNATTDRSPEYATTSATPSPSRSPTATAVDERIGAVTPDAPLPRLASSAQLVPLSTRMTPAFSV
jgi:hypothetical protein